MSNDKAEILMRFEKSAENLLSEIETDIGLDELEIIERETHFEGFRLRFIEEART